MFQFNLSFVFRESDIKTEAWELLGSFPALKKLIARETRSRILPFTKDITAQFGHTGPEEVTIRLISSG